MKTLQSFFEHQADSHPDSIALICFDSVLSYTDLEHRANRWAHLLQSQGAKPGDIIGLLLPRTVDLYAVILAILKIGAAYLPFDPEFPADRIQYMLSDCQAKIVVSSSELAAQLENSNQHYQVLYIDRLITELANQPGTRPDENKSQISPDSLCYVIYTSGSTGQPKGVEITQENICHFLQSARNIYGITHKDRIYQGFSIAFDASIEEIWMAFANGATLIVGASNSVHAGASLVEFLNLHGVTVLSTIPTLLSILDGEIPSLRLLILGGEVCPLELVKKWHRSGLRIINTYGPTEATIVSTYYEYEPNKPITIGKPLPDYEAFIFDENLQSVALGKVGELYIGGKGVARGYVNKPNLNQQKFINHPEQTSLRLYRTGDLVSKTAEGQIQFLGRADEQVKLRGFRIELSEIEAVIAEDPAIRKAVVALQELTPGVQSLVAYLVLKEDKKSIDLDQLNKRLHTRLPEYMSPSLYEIIQELPLLASGKVDRKHLPKPTMHDDKISQDYVAPTTELEKKITNVWEELFQHHPISVAANFFHELGGHSLLAAKAVSLLRKDPKMSHISMLDIYENPSIKGLAEKADKIAGESEADANHAKSPNKQVPKWRYRFCALGQLCASYITFGLYAWQFLLIILVIDTVVHRYSVFSWEFFNSLILLLLAVPPALFIITIAMKWLLVGRMKPGNYPLWGWFYIRWWLLQRIQKVPPVEKLIGSPLMNLYCRCMGAKIGKDCYIGTDFIKIFDLLEMGDDCSVGYNANLNGYIIEDGWLKLGKITIGNNCFVGTKTVLNINTKLADGAMLGDLSMLPANTSIPAGEYYHGSPARPQNESAIKHAVELQDHARSTKLQTLGFGLLHYLGLLFVTVIYYLAFLPGLLIIEYFYDQLETWRLYLIGVPIGSALFLVLFCASVVIVKKLLQRTTPLGSYKLRSFFYLRNWIVERLIDTEDLDALADSLYFPFYLRMLGAKIGKRVEMAELPHVPPDLLTIHDEAFTASFALIGVPCVYRGYAHFAPINIGKRAFVGNFALLPPGTELGPGCLIGALSIPPVNGDAAKPNTSWFGSPAVFLPRREIFEGFSEKETFSPTKSSYLLRASIEFIRIILPSMFAFISLITIFHVIDYLSMYYSILSAILVFPLCYFVIMVGLTLVAVALKWILIGRLKGGAKPVWSVFIWKYDIFEHLFSEFIGPAMFYLFLGTPFAPFLLKLLGVKMGKRVFVDNCFFAEYDLIEIGDDVALNENADIQTHLYEDRIFKMGPIKINKGCNVGCDSIVLYNTVMEEHSTLGSLSVLMKGETLPAYSHWEGVPAQHVSRYVLNFSQSSLEKKVTNSAYAAQ